jgi:hypothetical protein
MKFFPTIHKNRRLLVRLNRLSRVDQDGPRCDLLKLDNLHPPTPPSVNNRHTDQHGRFNISGLMNAINSRILIGLSEQSYSTSREFFVSTTKYMKTEYVI